MVEARVVLVYVVRAWAEGMGCGCQVERWRGHVEVWDS